MATSQDTGARGYAAGVSYVHVPQPVLDLAHARRRAREARDWVEADRLLGEIRTAGWTVVDSGSSFSLSPIRPADVIDGGRTLYGASESVPSRLDEAAVGLASVILRLPGPSADLDPTLRVLAADGPSGVQLIVVATDAGAEEAARLEAQINDAGYPEGEGREIVWFRAGGTPGRDLNGGIRRAAAGVVIVLAGDVVPAGDLVTPLVRALADPTVAVAGRWGRVGPKVDRLAAATGQDVAALDGRCVAFRRSDYLERGPLDEGFHGAESLGLWWSLVLRDAGPDASPRRAAALADLPVHEAPVGEAADRPGGTTPSPGGRDRQERRDFYRLLERFGSRPDLFTNRS